MRYLLDTNVVSELRKKRCDKKVLSFFAGVARSDLFISVFSISEIRKGILELPDGDKKSALTRWFEQDLPALFQNQILAVDCGVIEHWSYLVAKPRRTLPFVDAIIAATCLCHDLTLLTRNTKDFRDIQEIKIVNPWQ